MNNRIKYYRTQAGISQKELADKVNKDKSTISRYEKNDIQPPDLTKVAISNILKAKITDIFFQESVDYNTTQDENLA